MTDVVWLAAIVIAAIGPMVQSTFSRNPAMSPVKYVAFTFVWPFVVLSSLPLLWSDELSPAILAVTALVFISMVICTGVFILRRR
ncbi:hypothetical protein [Thiohalomonas denitrificans]|uniref:Uncharacterized protein n=1 Tax=Thiohalomonas denitrificans TaxID=415747 RepID=A0A1G5QBL6_9GAMM|nr:hypothetical protein [Thiohalomonas denitrificans]SCZ59087.1 hypothetical protein SAMN03097708_01785 [Thiohalomonas denitrificans]